MGDFGIGTFINFCVFMAVSGWVVATALGVLILAGII